MIYLVFIPIIIAVLVYLSHNKFFTKISISVNILELFLIMYLIKKTISTGPLESIVGEWSPIVGISIRLDILNGILLLVTSTIFALVMYHSLRRWNEDYKFYFFLHFLRGSVYGLIIANDFFNMFLFVEIISLISAILIIYKKDGASLKAGIYYLLFNSIGMIFYLIGLIIIYSKTGTMAMSSLGTLEMDTITKVGIALFIASAGVKSAYFPVYNWLPRAHMAAPSEISALLSGILVKMGFISSLKIFRLIDYSLYSDYLLTIGLLTAFLGLIFAISQENLKSILAFHTVSQSGLILIGISQHGIIFQGGFLHIINHALFKTLLFLSAGLIINKFNMRNVKELKGVFKRLPITSITLIIGTLAITGAPFTSGFVSKTLIKEGFYNFELMKWLLHLFNIGTFISFIKISQIFFGVSHNKKIKESFTETIPVIILSLILIGVGIAEYSYYYSIIDFKILTDVGVYLIYGVISYSIYRLFIEKDLSSMKKLRDFRLGFRDANLLLISFVILTILFI